MSESPESNDIVPEDPDIPDEYPSGDEGAEAEIDDAPMGTQPGADPDEQSLPGIPTGNEPPDAG